MNDIVVVGSGGFGREVVNLIEEINVPDKKWNIIGYVDDFVEKGTMINGYPVLGNLEWLKIQTLNVVFAIGDPIVKKKLVFSLKESKNVYPILIHPSVIYSKSVSIGEGTIITAANILTVNICIGKHVIINLDCTVGHDVKISDYVTVLPSVNVSGHVLIKECVSIGTGTAIIQGKTIEKNSVIGAGSVIVKDIPANCVAVGSPAKPIRFFA